MWSLFKRVFPENIFARKIDPGIEPITGASFTTSRD